MSAADPVSELRFIHLLEAHSAELLAECHRAGLYLAVCGEQLAAGELPALDCEPGCEQVDVYCLACIREATRHNHDAGADCPHGSAETGEGVNRSNVEVDSDS